MEHKDRTYRGWPIRPCCWSKGQHYGRWIVQARHMPTGIPYSDEECSHFNTIAEARAAVDLYIRAGATA
jgi:hypothetical protein